MLEANFLNINNNDKQIPLQPTENAHTSKKAWEWVLAGVPERGGGEASLGRTGKGNTAQAIFPLVFMGCPFRTQEVYRYYVPMCAIHLFVADMEIKAYNIKS